MAYHRQIDKEKHLRKPFVLLLVVLGLVLTACGGSDDPDSDPGSETTTNNSQTDAAITIKDFAFSGATEVAAGTNITVTNEDNVTHTWTSTDDNFNSGGIDPGISFTTAISEPGEYSYFCSIHPTMTGTITVTG